MCTYKGCEHQNHSNSDECIFHLVKSTKPLWEEFRKSIHNQIQHDNDFNFIGYKFSYGFHNFDEGTTLDGADFSDANFHSNVSFQKINFVGITKFANIKGRDWINFKDCQFNGLLHIEKIGGLFLEKVTFDGANSGLKINDVESFYTENPERIVITKCRFLAQSKLEINRLENDSIRILDCVFQLSTCYFQFVRVESIFHFLRNNFNNSVIRFYKSDFKGKEFIFGFTNKFDELSKLKFILCSFVADYTDFSDVNFSCKTDFLKCKFKEYSDFRNTTGLENCLFRQTNVDNINIEGVSWENNGIIRDESVLEIVNGENEDYEKLSEQEQKAELIKAYKHAEDTYRKLKYNYDSIRDYSRSSMFYIREKECARQSKGRIEKFGLGFLLVTCKYGESITRVLVSSLIIILLWTEIFLFAGFKNGDDIINYDLTSNISFPKSGDFKLAFGLSAKTFFIALKQFEDLKTFGSAISILGSLESLIGVFFVGLFVFVFRRYLRK